MSTSDTKPDFELPQNEPAKEESLPELVMKLKKAVAPDLGGEFDQPLSEKDVEALQGLRETLDGILGPNETVKKLNAELAKHNPRTWQELG